MAGMNPAVAAPPACFNADDRGNHGAARFEDEVVPQCPVLPATLEQFTLNEQCGGRAEVFDDELADDGAAFALIDRDLRADAHRHAGQLWFTRPDGKHRQRTGVCSASDM